MSDYMDWKDLETRVLALTEPAVEPDKENYRLFYVVPSRKKARTRVRSGALVYVNLEDAEYDSGNNRNHPLPILTLHAPKSSFLWMNNERKTGLLCMNLVGWKEMTFQDRAEHYVALSMEKSLETPAFEFKVAGSVTGRLSSSKPNLAHGLSSLRNNLPKGPLRDQVKQVLFGSTYGMRTEDIIKSLGEKK